MESQPSPPHMSASRTAALDYIAETSIPTAAKDLTMSQTLTLILPSPIKDLKDTQPLTMYIPLPNKDSKDTQRTYHIPAPTEDIRAARSITLLPTPAIPITSLTDQNGGSSTPTPVPAFLTIREITPAKRKISIFYVDGNAIRICNDSDPYSPDCNRLRDMEDPIYFVTDVDNATITSEVRRLLLAARQNCQPEPSQAICKESLGIMEKLFRDIEQWEEQSVKKGEVDEPTGSTWQLWLSQP